MLTALAISTLAQVSWLYGAWVWNGTTLLLAQAAQTTSYRLREVRLCAESSVVHSPK